ncbi:MAG: hypothetical protein QE263_09280 [Vampirovibrionales bacterium]|nr:hypothetical protein [Vampirovibrionales bacterium]
MMNLSPIRFASARPQFGEKKDPPKINTKPKKANAVLVKPGEVVSKFFVRENKPTVVVKKTRT